MAFQFLQHIVPKSANKPQGLFVPGGEQDNAFSQYKDPGHIVMVLFYK